VPQKLQIDTRVEKSLANLRAMGLKVELLPESDNEVLIFIRLDSIVKLIERRIPYPNKTLKIEHPFIVVDLWRG